MNAVLLADFFALSFSECIDSAFTLLSVIFHYFRAWVTIMTYENLSIENVFSDVNKDKETS